MGKVYRDGILIPEPEEHEAEAFNVWLQENDVREPFHPDQHYDYVGAFRAGLGRQKNVPEGHFTDQFELPGHKTFSNESQYAQIPRFAIYAGSWPENAQSDDDFIPPTKRYAEDQEPLQGKRYPLEELP